MKIDINTIGNYFLDINNIPNDKLDYFTKLYNILIDEMSKSYSYGGLPPSAKSLFNTLYFSGYLADATSAERNQKLDKIIN